MSNPFAQFLDLLPKDKIVIGKVTIPDNGYGKVEVELPGTKQHILVRGDGSDNYSVGSFVYIENNVIKAKTPNISAVNEVIIT